MNLFTHILDVVQKKTFAGIPRSPKWPAVRAEWLKNNPVCVVCGGVKKLQVHHRIPFHIDRSKELDPMNLVTMCEAKKYGVNCHLLVGHNGSYRRFNTYLGSDIPYVSSMLKAGPRG